MISIVIPCHNYGRYLTDCINSLVGGKTSLGMMAGQTVTDFEAIIVNDASTDNTHAVASKLARLDRVRYVNLRANRGTAGAFNAGIEAARGEWIMQLSADDMLEPYALACYLAIQEKYPHSFVYGNQRLFAYGRRLKMFFKRPQEYDFEANLIRNHIPASMMYPKQAWAEIGGIPEIMGSGREDWAWGIALGIWGYCGEYLHDSGYLYRREGQNRTHRNKKDMPAFAQTIYQLFPSIYEGFRPMGCCGKRGERAASASRGRAARRPLPGAQGMTQLEYIGKSHGAQTFFGERNQAYRAGLSNPRIFVDDRDVNTLLQLREKGRPIFQKYQAPKVKPVALPANEAVTVPPAWIGDSEEKDLAQSIVTTDSEEIEWQITDANSGPEKICEATPAAIKLAKEEGIDLLDLYDGKRITKRDVQQYIKARAGDSGDV
jgi:hypothetical protein